MASLWIVSKTELSLDVANGTRLAAGSHSVYRSTAAGYWKAVTGSEFVAYSGPEQRAFNCGQIAFVTTDYILLRLYIGYQPFIIAVRYSPLLHLLRVGIIFSMHTSFASLFFVPYIPICYL
jgi:hypothetical protein